MNTGDRVMVLAFSDSPHDPLSMYQVSFNFLVYFHRHAPDKHFIAKIKSNSVITDDRVMILALCTTYDGLLSMYQGSFNSFVYFQRYALNKLFIAKIKKGSNSVNIVDRVTILALSIADGPLSIYQVSFNSLVYFQIRSGQAFCGKNEKGN